MLHARGPCFRDSGWLHPDWVSSTGLHEHAIDVVIASEQRLNDLYFHSCPNNIYNSSERKKSLLLSF